MAGTLELVLRQSPGPAGGLAVVGVAVGQAVASRGAVPALELHQYHRCPGNGGEWTL